MSPVTLYNDNGRHLKLLPPTSFIVLEFLEERQSNVKTRSGQHKSDQPYLWLSKTTGIITGSQTSQGGSPSMLLVYHLTEELSGHKRQRPFYNNPIWETLYFCGRNKMHLMQRQHIWTLLMGTVIKMQRKAVIHQNDSLAIAYPLNIINYYISAQYMGMQYVHIHLLSFPFAYLWSWVTHLICYSGIKGEIFLFYVPDREHIIWIMIISQVLATQRTMWEHCGSMNWIILHLGWRDIQE